MNWTSNKIKLINETYNKRDSNQLLRQYELFVKSSEEVSCNRMKSNNFYLGANIALFTVAGYLSILSKPIVGILLSLMGIFLCASWGSNLASYKRLNHAKFKVIHELEIYLPAKLFTKEDEYLNGYYTLTKLEKYIPYFFILLYLIIILIFSPPLILQLLNKLNFGGYI